MWDQDLPFRPCAASDREFNEITSFLYLLKMTPFHLEVEMVLLEPLLQRPQGNNQIWSSVLLILPNLLQSFATVFSWLEKKRIKGSQISLSLRPSRQELGAPLLNLTA